MAHKFGALTLPAPAVGPGQTATDPALDILGEYFLALLKHYLADAWASIAPGEKVVESVRLYDPQACDFVDTDLPALYLWRSEDPQTQVADGLAETVTRISVYLVTAPSNQFTAGTRYGFFNGFEKVIARGVRNERDVQWVQKGDTSEAAQVYGSQVVDAAGFESWRLTNVERAPLVIQVQGASSIVYEGYLATIEARELSSEDITGTGPGVLDPTYPGLAPTQVDFTLVTEGPNPVTLQHERDPDTP